jgi:preprotein translocase subunit Sec63
VSRTTPSSQADPYKTLGVKSGASDAEIRSAYHRLVQLHHPDHNGGSAEAARRFEEVQEAYAQITRLRRVTPHVDHEAPRSTVDPDVESRVADIGRQVREAQTARERARRAAQEAASPGGATAL